MFKYLIVIIYSVCVAEAGYRLNRSLSEGFRVQKYRTNYQSGWSVQEVQIVIPVKAESIINYSIKQYQAIKQSPISFVARIKLRTQSLQMFWNE